MKTKAIRPGNLLFLLGLLAVAGCNSSSADTNTADTKPLAFQPAPEIRQAQPTPAAPDAAPLPIVEPNLDFTPSPNLADLIKLARSGVSESLMLKFIQNTPGAFGLGAAEIIYLNDLGVSETIINAMMERDRAYATAPQAAPTAPAPAPAPVVVVEPAPVTVNYFNETLSPYGTWVEVDGYGRCWQPTVIAYQTDWQPYRDRGRWIYSDCGWYWASDYSWGNIAFHYGRWFRDSHRGWCWSPDTIWAPAWVSWRNNNDYCGWAPLPPAAHYRPGIGFTYYDRNVGFSFDFGLRSDCYTFVSRNRFTDSHLRSHTRPHHEVTQIFNNTTVNNHYSDGGRSGRVFNHGIAPAVITAGTANQIRPVLAPVPAAPGVRPDRDQLTRSSRNQNQSPATGPDARAARPQAVTALAADRTATPNRSNLDRSRGNNPPRDRETTFRRPTPEPTRPTPSMNLTAANPATPAPTITAPSVRSREVHRPAVVGPTVNRPAPFDRESRNAVDSSRNSTFRPPSPSPVRPTPAMQPATPRPTPAPTIIRPAAHSVSPQPDRNERPNAYNIPSRNSAFRSPSPNPEPRSQPSIQPRHPTPQSPAQTFRAQTPTPSPQIRQQPAAPTFTPPPQRPQYQPSQPTRTPPPSFTPRPAPAVPAAQAPSAPRMESRPAPAPAPAAPARNESRSGGSDREKRNR